MLSLDALITSIASWMAHVHSWCPSLLIMQTRRWEDKKPLERILIAVLVQVITGALAVAVGVYVAVQILENKVSSNAKAISEVTKMLERIEDRSDKRWDEYNHNRIEDLRNHKWSKDDIR